MYYAKKKGRIFLHIIGILGACLLCGMALFLTRYCMPESVPSKAYSDIVMSKDSRSALDLASLHTVNSKLDGMRVYGGHFDSQLILDFRDDISNIRSVEVELEDEFPYDLGVMLYYPNKHGEYEEDCRADFTLPKGERKIYFEIPDDVTYPMEQLRVDIDEDYTIREIMISDKEIGGEYILRERDLVPSAAVMFIALVFLYEIMLCVWPQIAKNIGQYWTKRKEIGKLVLLLVGGAAAGDAAAWLVFYLAGKQLSWFWAVLITFCSVIMGYQIHLLCKKQPALKSVRREKPEQKRVMILFWASIVIFCLLIGFEWVDGSGKGMEIADKIRFQFPFIFAAAETILLALLYQKYVLNVQENSISFLNVYMFLFLLLGISYMLLFLPFVSPDEPSHYLSAYRVSNVFLGKFDQLGDQRLLMRMEDYLFYDQRQKTLNSEYYMQITENFGLFANDPGYMVIDAPMVTNAIFSYLTTGLGIAVARMFHLSAEMTFLAGRFANLLFFMGVLYFLMKKIPFGRTALFAISMMPMTLHMAASFSYDVTTFCLVALFVTQVMCMICSIERISRRDYVLCIIYGILMAPSKMVYLPLLFLVLLVPDEKLGDSRKEAWWKKLKVIGISIGSAFVVMLAVNLVGANSAIRTMMEESATVNMVSWAHEPGYTIGWVITHLGEYILMCVRTVIQMSDYYFFTMIGSHLGWLDIGVPYLYAVIVFILFLLSANIRDDLSEQVKISAGRKVWILVLCAGTVFCTMLVLTLDWTPISYDYVSGVQGRYFVPLLLPMIWLLKNSVIQVSTAIRKHIVFLLTMINVWILVYIFAQAIIGA